MSYRLSRYGPVIDADKDLDLNVDHYIMLGRRTTGEFSLLKYCFFLHNIASHQ